MRWKQAHLFLVTLTALLLGGCGGGDSEDSQQAAPSDTLRVAFTDAAPDVLDPPLIFSHASINLGQNIFDGLTTFNAEDQLVPNIASSWEVSDDGLVYTFKLRDDVEFSDGDPVTAHDFVYSLNRTMDPDVGSPISFYLAPVDGYEDVTSGKSDQARGIKALDDTTLRITLTAPTAEFPLTLATPIGWVVNQKVVEEHGEDWANAGTSVGTGPYRLTKRTGNTSFEFEVNPNYFGEPPSSPKVTVTVVPNQTAAVARYQQGEFDAVEALSGAALRTVADDPTLSEERGSASQVRTNWIGWDVTRPPFDDKRVRLAFAHGIDKQALIDVALNGAAEPAKSWIPLGTPGNINDAWDGYDYDLERARSLLAEAGYPNGDGFPEGEIRYSNETIGWTDAVAELLQQQLSTNLGIDLQIRNMPRQAYFPSLEDPANRPLIHTYTFGSDVPDPATLIKFFGISEGPFNYENWSNEEYDALFEEASATPDADERYPLYAEGERLRMEEVIVLPLFYPKNEWLAKPHVENFGMTGAYLTKWARMSLQE